MSNQQKRPRGRWAGLQSLRHAVRHAIPSAGGPDGEVLPRAQGQRACSHPESVLGACPGQGTLPSCDSHTLNPTQATSPGPPHLGDPVTDRLGLTSDRSTEHPAE